MKTITKGCIDKPLYEHDCISCIYLGEFEGADLYFCRHEPTVIARYSSDGSDYSSSLAFVGYTEALTEAYKRAKEKGLITKSVMKRIVKRFPHNVENY